MEKFKKSLVSQNIRVFSNANALKHQLFDYVVANDSKFELYNSFKDQNIPIVKPSFFSYSIVVKRVLEPKYFSVQSHKLFSGCSLSSTNIKIPERSKISKATFKHGGKFSESWKRSSTGTHWITHLLVPNDITHQQCLKSQKYLIAKNTPILSKIIQIVKVEWFYRVLQEKEFSQPQAHELINWPSTSMSHNDQSAKEFPMSLNESNNNTSHPNILHSLNGISDMIPTVQNTNFDSSRNNTATLFDNNSEKSRISSSRKNNTSFFDSETSLISSSRNQSTLGHQPSFSGLSSDLITQTRKWDPNCFYYFFSKQSKHSGPEQIIRTHLTVNEPNCPIFGTEITHQDLLDLIKNQMTPLENVFVITNFLQNEPFLSLAITWEKELKNRISNYLVQIDGKPPSLAASVNPFMNVQSRNVAFDLSTPPLEQMSLSRLSKESSFHSLHSLKQFQFPFQVRNYHWAYYSILAKRALPSNAKITFYHIPPTLNPLKNVPIVSTGWEPEYEKQDISEMISYLGGRSVENFSDINTILIANRTDTQKYSQARSLRVPIVNILWLQEVLFRKKFVDPENDRFKQIPLVIPDKTHPAFKDVLGLKIYPLLDPIHDPFISDEEFSSIFRSVLSESDHSTSQFFGSPAQKKNEKNTNLPPVDPFGVTSMDVEKDSFAQFPDEEKSKFSRPTAFSSNISINNGDHVTTNGDHVPTNGDHVPTNLQKSQNPMNQSNQLVRSDRSLRSLQSFQSSPPDVLDQTRKSIAQSNVKIPSLSANEKVISNTPVFSSTPDILIEKDSTLPSPKPLSIQDSSKVDSCVFCHKRLSEPILFPCLKHIAHLSCLNSKTSWNGTNPVSCPHCVCSQLFPPFVVAPVLEKLLKLIPDEDPPQLEQKVSSNIQTPTLQNLLFQSDEESSVQLTPQLLSEKTSILETRLKNIKPQAESTVVYDNHIDLLPSEDNKNPVQLVLRDSSSSTSSSSSSSTLVPTSTFEPRQKNRLSFTKKILAHSSSKSLNQQAESQSALAAQSQQLVDLAYISSQEPESIHVEVSDADDSEDDSDIVSQENASRSIISKKSKNSSKLLNSTPPSSSPATARSVLNNSFVSTTFATPSPKRKRLKTNPFVSDSSQESSYFQESPTSRRSKRNMSNKSSKQPQDESFHLLQVNSIVSATWTDGINYPGIVLRKKKNSCDILYNNGDYEKDVVLERISTCTTFPSPSLKFYNGPVPVPHFLIRASSSSKSKLIKAIDSLGGVILDCHQEQPWNPKATHLIRESVNRSAAFLCAVAAGIWILKPSFIEASLKAGHWVKAQPHAWVLNSHDSKQHSISKNCVLRSKQFILEQLEEMIHDQSTLEPKRPAKRRSFRKKSTYFPENPNNPVEFFSKTSLLFTNKQSKSFLKDYRHELEPVLFPKIFPKIFNEYLSSKSILYRESDDSYLSYLSSNTISSVFNQKIGIFSTLNLGIYFPSASQEKSHPFPSKFSQQVCPKPAILELILKAGGANVTRITKSSPISKYPLLVFSPCSFSATQIRSFKKKKISIVDGRFIVHFLSHSKFPSIRDYLLYST